jgi:Fatty acid desaturase
VARFKAAMPQSVLNRCHTPSSPRPCQQSTFVKGCVLNRCGRDRGVIACKPYAGIGKYTADWPGRKSAISKYCSSAYCLSPIVHGQDIHVIHHLVPGVPHRRLRRLHRLLKGIDADDAAQVVECRGTFANRLGLQTILDTLEAPG